MARKAIIKKSKRRKKIVKSEDARDMMKYISALEKELSVMRKDCDFYYANQATAMKFLKARDELLIFGRMESLKRAVKVGDLREDMREWLEKHNEMALIKQKEMSQQKQRHRFQEFMMRNTVKNEHLDSEIILKKEIAAEEKLLDFNYFQKDLEKLNLREECNLDNSKTMKSIFQEYAAKFIAAEQEFYSKKLRTLISVFDIKDTIGNSTEESFVNGVRRMHGFFSEMSTSSKNAINLLSAKLNKLQMECSGIEFRLQKVTDQNSELKKSQSSASSNACSGKMEAVPLQNAAVLSTVKKFEALQLLNQVLKQKLQISETELQDMKNQFISAIRKINQEEAYKTFLVGEMIRANRT